MIICSLNAIVTQPKTCPLGVNTTIELKNTTTSSENNRHCHHLEGLFHPTTVPILSDVATLFSSIVAFAPNAQCLRCATIPFSEQMYQGLRCQSQQSRINKSVIEVVVALVVSAVAVIIIIIIIMLVLLLLLLLSLVTGLFFPVLLLNQR